MSSQDELFKLLYWAYWYLGFRLRSEREMYDYLVKKAQTYGFPTDRVQETLDVLREEKYIDDQRFTEEFVSSRSRSKPKGEYALRIELKRKGVPDGVIEEYFQRNKVPEDELAIKALRKIWHRYPSIPLLEKKKKVIAHLQRRGFGYGAIQKAIEEMNDGEYN